MAMPSIPEGGRWKDLVELSPTSFLGSRECLLPKFFVELFQTVHFGPEFSFFAQEGDVHRFKGCDVGFWLFCLF